MQRYEKVTETTLYEVLKEKKTDIARMPVFLSEGTVAHAARGGDGRQEGRECGYYHLHRNLNNALLHTLLGFSYAFGS